MASRPFIFARPCSTKQRLLALYGVVFVGLLAAWALYATFGQGVIEAAYRGESLAIFNRMITGQGEHALPFYVALAAQAMLALTGLALALTAMISLAIVDSGAASSPLARYGITLLGPVLAVAAFASAAIVFFYPLEIETRESTVWLHVLAEKNGIDIYDHAITAFVDMNHGPLGPLVKYWIASLLPFLAPWQVTRFFVFLLPFVFVFVGWKLTASASGTSKKQVLFLSGLGFAMLLVTAREFLFVGRADATIAVLLLLALYASLSSRPQGVPAAVLHGALAGILGIGMVLTIWRLAPVTFGVFVFSLWRFYWIERLPRKTLWAWAAAYGLTCVTALSLVVLIVFHGDLRLYYGHFFSYFAATAGPGGKHYGGSVPAFLASLFNPTAAPDDYKGGPLLLAAFVYAMTWGQGGATAKGLKVLSFFALVASAAGYYFAYQGGGSWHFIPFFLVLWAYLCSVEASIPRARLAWIGLCVVGLVGLSASTDVVPTLQRAARRGEAMTFLNTLQTLDATHSLVSEDLFFFRTSYHGEVVDIGEDTTLLLGDGVIDDAFARTVRRHFDRLRSDPPDYILEGIGGSPELEQLIRDKYVLVAKGPGNLTGNGPSSSRLFRRRDLAPPEDANKQR